MQLDWRFFNATRKQMWCHSNTYTHTCRIRSMERKTKRCVSQNKIIRIFPSKCISALYVTRSLNTHTTEKTPRIAKAYTHQISLWFSKVEICRLNSRLYAMIILSKVTICILFVHSSNSLGWNMKHRAACECRWMIHNCENISLSMRYACRMFVEFYFQTNFFSSTEFRLAVEKMCGNFSMSLWFPLNRTSVAGAIIINSSKKLIFFRVFHSIYVSLAFPHHPKKYLVTLLMPFWKQKKESHA